MVSKVEKQPVSPKPDSAINTDEIPKAANPSTALEARRERRRRNSAACFSPESFCWLSQGRSTRSIAPHDWHDAAHREPVGWALQMGEGGRGLNYKPRPGSVPEGQCRDRSDGFAAFASSRVRALDCGTDCGRTGATVNEQHVWLFLRAQKIDLAGANPGARHRLAVEALHRHLAVTSRRA